MTQDHVFSSTESDAYYRRNAVAMSKLHDDLPIRLLRDYHLDPPTILEVGASTGYRLHLIKTANTLRLVAVEPSAEAIADGRSRYQGIEYIQSTAADMRIGEQFDLVIVNYVLHWVDRSRLLESVAKIDAAVKDGGFLLLGDFAPDNKVANPYRHHPAMYTYKQDYQAIFLASGLYHVVGALTGVHGVNRPDPYAPEQERYGLWLLRKQLNDHYLAGGDQVVKNIEGA